MHELMLAHQRLAPLRKAVESRTKQLALVKKGPKAHVAHSEAVKGLWLLWHEATGERPGSSRTRNTPFYTFAHTAMQIVWPGIQSFTGTIGKVCTEMRKLVP